MASIKRGAVSAILLAFLCTFSLVSVFAQRREIIGPVVIGKPEKFGDEIVLQDVGSGKVVKYKIPFESMSPPYYLDIIDWSSNGCYVLLERVYDRREFIILSIVDSRLINLPDLSLVLHSALWHPDGQHITLVIDEEDLASVYLMDVTTSQMKLLFSEESLSLSEWITPNRLIYWHNGEPFIWDILEQQKQPLNRDKFPADYALIARDPSRLPGGWDWFLHIIEASPDHQMLTHFFSRREYASIKHAGQGDDYRGDPDEVPQIPGFDIYFYESDMIRHVDVEGFLVRDLIWSPSGEMIAVSIYDRDEPGGIFIYDVETDELHQVKNDEIVASPGGFEPAWSPNEEWLTVNLKGNRSAIYRISDGETIELSDQFKGTTLYWSPVIDYSETQCSASE